MATKPPVSRRRLPARRLTEAEVAALAKAKEEKATRARAMDTLVEVLVELALYRGQVEALIAAIEDGDPQLQIDRVETAKLTLDAYKRPE